MISRTYIKGSKLTRTIGVGPMIGALIAVFFYKFIKMLEYEMANPGQDGDDKNDPTKSPVKREQMMQERKMSIRT